MKTLLILSALSGAAFFGASAALAQNHGQTPLIPRDVLFGNPDKSSPQLSPDGTKIAFLAPVDGVMNVWVGPVADPEQARPVTKDDERGIRIYFWAHTNQNILYLQDVGGDEDWQLFNVNLRTGESTNLTPFDHIPGPDGEPMVGPDGKTLRPTAQIQEVSHKRPNEILIGLNNRDPRFHDIYTVNLRSNELELKLQNPGMLGEGFVAGFLTDDEYNVRLAQTFRTDGGSDIFKPEADGEWELFQNIDAADSLTTSPVGFDKTGKILYMLDSRDRNTAALFAVDIESGETSVLAENEKADLSGAMIHPTEKHVQAVTFTYTRLERQILDRSIRGDFAYLRSVADGDIQVISRTTDDKQWLVAYILDDGPVRYYHYDRETRRARFLFTNRRDLEGLPLAKMHDVVIPARDGLNLVSYYTLPTWADPDGTGEVDEPLPMVLLVHGGPWARDNWGYNPLHQLLANRGYAVLSVNFRGSTGFGKDFINASTHEWAGAMHDDLIDAVEWAVDHGIAHPDQVGIMGGSYGGYATLVGLTFTPDVFACGVDIVGPSNLITLLESIPPYWTSFAEIFRQRVGDLNTEEGRELLWERSPLRLVDEIKRPLLIGQGANDPRVKQAESDQIVEAMQKNEIPVTYVLYPDEGHGFARPENRLSFYAVAEGFLAQHLGGRYEPIGDDFEGSSIAVPEGANLIPGLREAVGN
ncbi:MAG: S9 family peptidase [Phycisphaeraceae bacterium]|nr:MAG: S9 family peptidase [Phycisphaeraceae bacterium]